MSRTLRSSFLFAAVALAASAAAVAFVAVADTTRNVLVGAWHVARNLAEDLCMHVLAKLALAKTADLLEPEQRLVASKANARSIDKRETRIESGWRMCPST